MENTGIIWPAFLPNQILIGNPKSNVALVCGWTKRERMKKQLEAVDPRIMDKVAGIGQMYTAERGVDMLIRNLLANPRIDTIIFCGRDKSGASLQAKIFMQEDRTLQQGETSSGQKYITDVSDSVRVWGDIPLSIIERVRRRINCFYSVSESDRNDAAVIAEMIDKAYASKGPNELMDEPEVYEPPRPTVKSFPAPNSVQVLRVKTVADGWLELLHYIMTYGKRVATHYDQDTLEIMDLVMVITEQDPYEIKHTVHEFMPFMKEHVNLYVDALMSPDKNDDLTYTYGNLIRAHFGKDQLVTTAQKLAKDRDTKSAVISLWDPNNPMKGSPCLNHIWFRILAGKINMTATIRSNDMFQGWPENAYGLRAMQEEMRGMVLAQEGEFMDGPGLRLGDLVIVSQSAHIYEDCWAPAQEIVAEHRKYKEWWDEKGQWTFEYVDRDLKVVATLHSPDGEFLTSIEGTPNKIRREIARRGLISDVGHALYVGQMLERAAKGFN